MENTERSKIAKSKAEFHAAMAKKPFEEKIKDLKDMWVIADKMKQAREQNKRSKEHD